MKLFHPKISLFILMLCLVWPLTDSTAQIHLKNASFEGEAQDATVPLGWFECTAYTTPDILPGVWGVYEEAEEGETYVGLITRANGTWESIGQRLPVPLEKGDCFSFYLFLAHSKTYSGYNKPIKLRIWGGTTRCEKDQLLLETDFVKHRKWKRYDAQFSAEKTINYFILEAFYSEEPYSHLGNILIDQISPIRKCSRAGL